VDFDENNGSQVEQVVQNVVGDADSSQVIRTMGIENILPMESCQDQVIPNEDSSSTMLNPLPQLMMNTPLKMRLRTKNKYLALNPMSKIKEKSKYFLIQMIKLKLIQVLLAKLKLSLLAMVVNLAKFVPPQDNHPWLLIMC
jgi:hypothetical protein